MAAKNNTIQTSAMTSLGLTSLVTTGDPALPALVLLHGAASNNLTWGADLPEYLAHFRIIAPDIPGEAGCSADFRPSWETGAYLEWLADIFDIAAIRKATLVGLSFGGWIAAGFAARHPDKVERLVLLTPAGFVPARATAVLKMILFSLQKEKGLDRMKQLVFGRKDIIPELSRFFDLLQEHYQPRFGSPPLLSDQELASIRAPLLMVSGQNDALFNVGRAARRLARLQPAARIVLIPDGQHAMTANMRQVKTWLGL